MNQHDSLIARAERALEGSTGGPTNLIGEMLTALKDVIVERDLAYGNFCQLRDDMDFSKVTRTHVVQTSLTHDSSAEYWADSWIISLQDDGQTLKLLGRGRGHQARQKRDVALTRDLGELLDRKPNAL